MLSAAPQQYSAVRCRCSVARDMTTRRRRADAASDPRTAADGRENDGATTDLVAGCGPEEPETAESPGKKKSTTVFRRGRGGEKRRFVRGAWIARSVVVVALGRSVYRTSGVVLCGVCGWRDGVFFLTESDG